MDEVKVTETLPKIILTPEFIEECRAIITEAVFTSRWTLIEGYWNLGKRIREESKDYSITQFIASLAVGLRVSERTLWYSIQFFDKYPSLDKLPEGKNISWTKLITKYLPQPKENKIEEPLPEGEFNVIYADPPWKYEHAPMGDISRSIEHHYPTMELEAIKALKVPMAESSVLFMWATAPKLAEAIEVINAWGFNYRTCAVWDKEIIGLGYWFRNQHELLLVATKGNFSPPPIEMRFSSVYKERRGEHSKKPEYYYELIEKMYPEGKYLELFARKARPGWESWGNDIQQ